ncbi:MAG: hypothetical protein PHR26_03010, partial [Candidatus ainarchaeum sp.]|nr:hypothetical protein [Candidatus ainarchaeum sp.]
NITALVIGILARRILAARKLLARQDAVKKFSTKDIDAEQMLEIEIPPTWMYIDEAHTLIPSGNTLTPATAGIIEYVKQGRRPGCSLVFATQQPSAINTKVLSQVDVLISNKLVFNDDIHAIQKRMPAIIPKQYKEPNFIKTLPFATALCGERSEETSRAFILRAGPRSSQHEGRDAETIRDIPKKSNNEILDICVSMIYNKLEKSKELKINFVKDIVDVVNVKYKSNILWDDVLDKLIFKNVFVDSEYIYLKKDVSDKEHELIKKDIRILEDDFEEDSILNNSKYSSEDIDDLDISNNDNLSIDKEVDGNVLLKQNLSSRVKFQNIISSRISRYKIEDIVKSKIKKNILFKPKEIILDIVLKYRPIYKINYNLFDQENNFKAAHCYIDSVTGEFIHFINSKLKESKGFSLLEKLESDDLDILYLLQKQQTLFSLSQELGLDQDYISKKYISKFENLSIIDISKNNNISIFKLSKDFDVPFNPTHKILYSLDDLSLRKEIVEFFETIVYPIDIVKDNLNKLWWNLEIISIEEIFWPIWYF